MVRESLEAIQEKLLWLGAVAALCWGFGATMTSANAHDGCGRVPTRAKSVEAKWRVVMKAFLSAREKDRKSLRKGARGRTALPAREYARWKKLLPQLKRALSHLSLPTLVQTRRLLEIESDRDRNRFFNFPQSLSLQVIKLIVAIDLRRGAYKRAKPRTRWRAVRVPGKPPKRASTRKKGAYAMGAALPSPQSLIQGTKPPVDESKLPPLVFTQRDLERYQNSKSLIGWPMAKRKVGSGYGWRRDPFTKRLRKHSGIDIGAPYGTSIWSAADGYVWRSGWLGSCGLGLLIRHNRSMTTIYCHLSQILAPVGKFVRRGQLIGKVGSTGRSTSPHLHFGLILRGRSVDPQKYLP